MKIHRTSTKYSAGVDLHTQNMYLCVCDEDGNVKVHRNIRNNSLPFLLKQIEPFKGDLTLCCESTCNWYFLHDFCVQQEIPFVLGHAMYIRAIAQSKVKNDKVDSRTLADLLRSNMLPVGYAMDRQLRIVRDLVRRRSFLVQKRTSFKSSLAMSLHMHGLDPLTASEKNINRYADALLARSVDPAIAEGWQSFLNVSKAIDDEVAKLEKIIVEEVDHIEKGPWFDVLTSFPGIGKVLAATILFEVGEIERFPSVQDFSSYCRVIVAEGSSAGKACGKRPGKIGNPNLNWAFAEAVITMSRCTPPIRAYYNSLQKKKGKRKARHILAHRLARAVYFCLQRCEPFNLHQFLKGKESFIMEKI